MKKVCRTINSVRKNENGIRKNDKVQICLCFSGAFLYE